MRLPFTLVDVFAARPLEGTLHAVVHDAAGLSDATMVRLAGRFRLPETSFVQAATPDAPGADYRHRIFTIEAEIPFAGHPSLGTAAAVAFRAGTGTARYVQQTLAGTQALEVTLDEGVAGGANEQVGGRVSLCQNPATFGATFPAGEAARALALPPDAADERLPVQLVSTGLPTLIVPLRDAGRLSRARADWDAVARLLGRPAATRELNLYAVAETAPGRWRARCFAQDITGGEDPATGSAAGPLGALVGRHLGTQELIVDQGIEIGSPSRIEVDTRDGIVVAGRVFVVGTGELRLPAAGGPGAPAVR